MFIYGPSNIKDVPSRVNISLNSGGRHVFELAYGTGCIVSPGGDVVIVDVDPNASPAQKNKAMRIKWSFPWEAIQSLSFEYDTPFPVLSEDKELKDLEEMLAREDKITSEETVN